MLRSNINRALAPKGPPLRPGKTNLSVMNTNLSVLYSFCKASISMDYRVWTCRLNGQSRVASIVSRCPKNACPQEDS